jgi:hypothetical protein
MGWPITIDQQHPPRGLTAAFRQASAQRQRRRLGHAALLAAYCNFERPGIKS